MMKFLNSEKSYWAWFESEKVEILNYTPIGAFTSWIWDTSVDNFHFSDLKINSKNLIFHGIYPTFCQNELKLEIYPTFPPKTSFLKSNWISFPTFFEISPTFRKTLKNLFEICPTFFEILSSIIFIFQVWK